MEPSHLAEVLAIERASFSIPWSEPSFLIEIHSPDARTYVALEEGVVAGYLCTKKVLREGHIQNLAVRDGLRRKGIAKGLVEKGLEDLRAEGCKCVYLEVRESNLPAIKLYEAFGFVKVGVRKAYYLHPVEDAVLMTLAF